MALDSESDASITKGFGPMGGEVAERDSHPSRRALNHAGTRSPVTVPPADVLSHEVPPLPSESMEPGGGGFGELLEPALRRACQDRLSPVSWFRTDWQRGGALTGYATYRTEEGRARPAVVKLPVPPCERYFLAQLQRPDLEPPVAPELYAHGETLNGYDLAWVVMERLPHGPLGPQWDGQEFDLLVEAVGRFYAATDAVPLQGHPVHEEWETLLARARQHAQNGALRQAQHWNKLLKAAGKKLSGWVKIWQDRPITGWCHGDLHLGNAMTRGEPPQGPALLFDFAKTRVGHWVQDAVYFEHLFWSRPHRLAGRKLAKQIAQERKRHGLPVEPEWGRLAEVYRTLLAMATPAMLDHEGDPGHLEACLAVLESATR